MSSDGFGPMAPQRPSGKPLPRPARLTPEISESILKSLQQRTGATNGTSEWVTGLSELESEILSAQEDATPVPSAAPVIDMVTEIEKLFDHFTKYAYEFNKSMNFSGPQLEVERPAHVKAGDPRHG